MQAHAAVFRTGSVLAEGCQKIDDIYNRTEDLKVQCTCDLASNHALVEEIFVENFKSSCNVFHQHLFCSSNDGQTCF